MFYTSNEMWPKWICLKMYAIKFEKKQVIKIDSNVNTKNIFWNFKGIFDEFYGSFVWKIDFWTRN